MIGRGGLLSAERGELIGDENPRNFPRAEKPGHVRIEDVNIADEGHLAPTTRAQPNNQLMHFSRIITNLVNHPARPAL